MAFAKLRKQRRVRLTQQLAWQQRRARADPTPGGLNAFESAVGRRNGEMSVMKITLSVSPTSSPELSETGQTRSRSTRTSHVCSGTYDSKLLLWDAFDESGPCTTLESTSGTSPRRSSALKGKLGMGRKDSLSGRNFNKKILHHSHHPNRNLVAIGARNSLYIFCAN